MDNKILISDDNGKEVELNILFTFDKDNKSYAVCYEGINEDELMVFTYDKDGNMWAVEDKEELKMVQEVIDAYDEEKENEK